MADQPVVHIGQNSPEFIALDLMLKIASVEGIAFHKNPTNATTATREWILDTYGECITTVVKGRRPRKGMSD